MNRIFLAMFFTFFGGCVAEYARTESEYFGDAAVRKFRLCDRSLLPKNISEAWVFDGGSFNGMIYYVSFKCETIEDCWNSVSAFDAPEKSNFLEGVATKFAVNEYGPNSYWPEFENPKWDVSSITNGVFFESSQGDRNMDFWAVDRERLRVYFHHESGGFPDEAPMKRHR